MSERPSLTQTQQAMRWWNSLTEEVKAGYRKSNDIRSLDVITRFWIKLFPEVADQYKDAPKTSVEVREMVYSPDYLRAVKDCRDMFVQGSVSWNLLNEKLEACSDMEVGD